MRKTPKMIGPAPKDAPTGRKNRTLGDGVPTPTQRVVLSLYRRDKPDTSIMARVRRKGW